MVGVRFAFTDWCGLSRRHALGLWAGVLLATESRTRTRRCFERVVRSGIRQTDGCLLPRSLGSMASACGLQQAKSGTAQVVREAVSRARRRISLRTTLARFKIGAGLSRLSAWHSRICPSGQLDGHGPALRPKEPNQLRSAVRNTGTASMMLLVGRLVEASRRGPGTVRSSYGPLPR